MRCTHSLKLFLICSILIFKPLLSHTEAMSGVKNTIAKKPITTNGERRSARLSGASPEDTNEELHEPESANTTTESTESLLQDDVPMQESAVVALVVPALPSETEVHNSRHASINCAELMRPMFEVVSKDLMIEVKQEMKTLGRTIQQSGHADSPLDLP